MKILLIEIYYYYIDYQTGGHLSFARNMLKAFGNDLVWSEAARINTPVELGQRKIDDVRFDYFSWKSGEKVRNSPLFRQIEVFLFENIVS